MVEDLQANDQASQTYLRVAETVLSATRFPLSAREIVERGIERGLFGDHVFGNTPEKSMQARLSLEIKNCREKSRFVRVAKGRFLLRTQLPCEGATTEPIEEALVALSEYIAQPRKARLPTERVLCVPEEHYKDILTFQGIDNAHDAVLPELLKKTIYVNRTHAEDRNDSKQFITYILLQCGHRLLSFRRSYLSRAAEFLRGARCVGFGGHVSEADCDIFSTKDFGLETCARRELSEELMLTTDANQSSGHHYATLSLFRNAPIECLGILNDDSSEVGRRHLAIVYRVWISDWQIAGLIRKGESSLKSLSWIDLTKSKLDITEFEYWSQLCLRRYYSSNVVSDPVIKHFNLRATQRARTLVVSGRVGSGKSETSRFLAQRLRATLISSGLELQQLMQAPSLQEIGREEFQRRAEKFIRSPNGPAQLAQRITQAVNQIKSNRVVIDGIRQLETYDALARQLGEQPALLYVQTPPDTAYEMYRLRESGLSLDFTYRDFLKVFDAPVEADLTTLGRCAQTYVFNFLGIDALRRSLEKLAQDLS